MIDVKIIGVESVTTRFIAMPSTVRTRLTVALNEIGVELTNTVQDKLSGSVLHIRTGKLRASISYKMVQDGDSQYIEDGSRRVPYAAIQEFGGTVHLPEIMPVNKRALHWTSGGDKFAAKTAAHSVTLPERSYIRSSVTEMRPQITERLYAAVRGLW